MRHQFVTIIALAASLTCSWSLAADSAPLVESYLLSGRLADGEQSLANHLKVSPRDDLARFGLGTLQLLQAIERVAQSLYHYGLRDQSNRIPLPILRMPLPSNPQPTKIGYADSRKILQTLVDDLAAAEKTLAAVESKEVKLPLHFGRIRLDLDGDGAIGEEETLWRIYARLNRAMQVSQADAESFVIAFDKADVAWLRGYCHLLMTLSEMVLAYDTHDLFDRTAHLFFEKVNSPFEFLSNGRKLFEFNQVDVVDVIAFIHLLNFPVAEPQRMQSALGHLQQVIALSRVTWSELLAETDDDHEWIPNPKQTGVIPNVRITQEMVDGWYEFLDETEQILQGKKLLPFWRGNDQRGINFKRVFTEPRKFDLVLWIQGTDIAPYLEAGEVTKPEVWRRLDRLFRGEFIGFAVWFN